MEVTKKSCTDVLELEKLVGKEVQVDLITNHNFHDGIYTRELNIPEGTIVVGKRHRESTINILLKGTMTILEGDKSFTIEAPCQFITDRFSKKAGYAHSDSVWLNIIRTDLTDLEQIEEAFTIPEDEFEKLYLGVFE